ncbi:MAG TPA: NADH-quinone oxidoreductase subunit NuoE [Candidatus Cloacimonetes bacterium]|nr:NADH-quinone oxidoreductase subunit NuoE [Candidatus Cloacimonadota bacterium]HEX37425.1 NADH-quinone oxidoreductase subunit NuoE [Candidatus Cloacimonadota bacterium]
MAESDFAKIDSVLEEYKGRKGALIPILQKSQANLGYLSKEALKYISDKTNIPVSEIYGVATFYTQFRLQPIGKHIVRICHGTACHVANAPKISEAIYEALEVEPGGTTEDLKFTVEEVACLGCCSLAPVIMIDDKTFGRLTPDKVKDILAKY